MCHVGMEGPPRHIFTQKGSTTIWGLTVCLVVCDRNQTLTLPLGYLTYRRTLIPDAKPTIFGKASPKMQHSSTQKPENVFQHISDLEKILAMLKR